jgi:hypothetical protein
LVPSISRAPVNAVVDARGCAGVVTDARRLALHTTARADDFMPTL